MPSDEMLSPGPIGVFDSGYGGLTILSEIHRLLPSYDFLYLGDNARAPYGERSFDVVYEFTLQAVKALFDRGCNLVILACNTASAKALRSIQQNYLPGNHPRRRVLGVIIPTVEAIGSITSSGHIGLFATPGTISSNSYQLETAKLYPGMQISGQACPLWVPLIENGEAAGPGADYFVEKYVKSLTDTDPKIDTLLLGCTHYPLLLPKIRQYVSPDVKIIPQGEIVAKSLANYLQRHPEMDAVCSKTGRGDFLTTEKPAKFNRLASLFLKEEVDAQRITLK